MQVLGIIFIVCLIIAVVYFIIIAIPWVLAIIGAIVVIGFFAQ